MKKYPLLLASLLFASLAAPVHAADADKSGMGMNKMDMDKMDSGKMADHRMMMGGKMMGMTGMHKMTGTVDKLDQATGMLALKTGAGDLMLHFPPPALKDLKNGDTITVQLGFHKESGTKK